MEIKATRYDSTPIRMSKIQDLIVLIADGAEKHHLCHASGSAKWYRHLGRQLEVSYNVNMVILWSTNHPSRYLLNFYDNLSPHKILHKKSIAALFVIAKNWKQWSCPSVSEYINNSWYIHTMKYYSVIKRMSYQARQQYGWILMHVAKWKKPVRKGYIRIWFNFHDILGKVKPCRC